jgi:hypothetical protein
VIILPIVSLIYSLIGRASVQVFVEAEKTTAEKMEPVSYEIKVINPSFLPYPFTTACIMLPDDVGVRCTEGYVKMSLTPFGGCFINKNVTFRYRGSYALGVGDLYISDLFRLFNLRKTENVYSTVTVYPRKLEFENPPVYSITDIPSDTASAVPGADRSEQSGIREYVPGDSLKSIHWKLSSKTQDLQVREFTTNDSRHVWVLCDLAGHREIKQEETESDAAIDEAQASEKAARAVGSHSDGLKDNKHIITDAIRAFIDKVKGTVRSAMDKRKRRRMMKRGVSESDADTIALIDQLIESNPKKQRRHKADDKAQSAESDKTSPQDESAQVSAASLDNEELERRIDLLEGEKKRGSDSAVAVEYAHDIDEYCADGVIEIAVSAVMRELMHGSRCTLAWFDSREDSGIMRCDIESLGDLERIYHRFSTAPCTTPEHEVSALASLVDGTGGMTVRVVTANIDPYAEASYEKMPSVYGGTGTGNVTEILLFNPEERYEDRAARRAYIDMCRAGLSSGGVELTEVRRFMYGDGVLRLVSVE